MTTKKVPAILKPGPLPQVDKQALANRMNELGKAKKKPKPAVQQREKSRGR